jgi:hypothetical protein
VGTNVGSSIWVTIRKYMEMSHEYSLCSYLKQTTMTFFSFTKSERGGQNRSCLGEGVILQGGEGGVERVSEGEYSANSVY